MPRCEEGFSMPLPPSLLDFRQKATGCWVGSRPARCAGLVAGRPQQRLALWSGQGPSASPSALPPPGDSFGVADSPPPVPLSLAFGCSRCCFTTGLCCSQASGVPQRTALCLPA
jgi:hypothetical protein